MPVRYVVSIFFSDALLSLLFSSWSYVHHGWDFMTDYKYDLGLHTLND
jgi:hypothetical protein